jgi:LAS superfamily LD-carboxypeptidase LdcB
MRIIDPKSINSRTVVRPKKVMKPKILLMTPLILLALISGYILVVSKTNESTTAINVNKVSEVESDENTKILKTETGLRKFSGNELRLLYDNLLLPNTKKVDTPPVITGNDIADARMRQLAETRGYKLRNDVDAALPALDGYQLQEIVHLPWKEMQTSASDEGLTMSIVSAYRSIEDQRELFVSRLQAEGVSIIDVENGIADAEITKVLVTTSLPGYSKHHSGYTIDLLCGGWIFENFKNSPCNDWLIKNNYENAKKFGFIPSYPLDADLQGPEPEAWEYVYVGTELLNQ